MERNRERRESIQQNHYVLLIYPGIVLPRATRDRRVMPLLIFILRIDFYSDFYSKATKIRETKRLQLHSGQDRISPLLK
jgi:hypothetical protein